jgi:hypothetical protein
MSKLPPPGKTWTPGSHCLTPSGISQRHPVAGQVLLQEFYLRSLLLQTQGSLLLLNFCLLFSVLTCRTGPTCPSLTASSLGDDLQSALFMCLASVGAREICSSSIWSIFWLLKPLNELEVIFPAVCTGRSRWLSISSTATAALYQCIELLYCITNHECRVRGFKCTRRDGDAWLCDPS